MEKASPSHGRFGDFELDLGLGRLCRDGQSVQLGEKPLRVLVTLIEQAAQVTRENLQQKLWPNDTSGIVRSDGAGRFRHALASPRLQRTLYEWAAWLNSSER